MSYDGRVYRVLIASPSDVETEREIAVSVIQQWNDLHSFARRVVLLPLRWETHTAPTYGSRPQEVINRAIVDECDLLIGIFWTRIGTPTGEAKSGTIEELTRVAKAGKPVMLYFSKAGADPESLDLDQVAKLQAFKRETYPNALTESYKSVIDFRDKLARQIEIRLREIQRDDTSGQKPMLSLNSLSVKDGDVTSGRIERFSSFYPTVLDAQEILGTLGGGIAKSMIEMRLRSAISNLSGLPLVLAISNEGATGVRNLFIELRLTGTFDDLEIKDASSAIDLGLPTIDLKIPTTAKIRLDAFEQKGITKTESGWSTTFDWDALQPQRIRIVSPQFWVVPRRSTSIEVTAKVFSESFAQPLLLSKKIDFVVEEKQMKLVDLVPDYEKTIRSFGKV